MFKVSVNSRVLVNNRLYGTSPIFLYIYTLNTEILPLDLVKIGGPTDKSAFLIPQAPNHSTHKD